MINLGLCFLVNCNKILTEVPTVVVFYLNMLLKLINKQKSQESKTIKKKNLYEINSNFLNKGEENTESDEDEHNELFDEEIIENKLFIKIDKNLLKDEQDFDSELFNHEDLIVF